MSSKDRPNPPSIRPGAPRLNSMLISLEDITVVVKKIKDKLPHFKSNDRDS